MVNIYLKGIGGWLLLVLVGLIISLLSSGMYFWQSFSVYQPDFWNALTTFDSEFYHPLFGTLFVYETILNGCLVIFNLLLLYLLFKKSPHFPKFMIAYFVSAVPLQLIDFTLGYSIFSTVPTLAEYFETDTISLIEGSLRSIFQAVVWVPYFIRSKRVKLTFLNKEERFDHEDKPTIPAT